MLIPVKKKMYLESGDLTVVMINKVPCISDMGDLTSPPHPNKKIRKKCNAQLLRNVCIELNALAGNVTTKQAQTQTQKDRT